MFIDTAKVSLKAGKGGDGAVSFRHEIYIPKGGPDGGDGGRGGNIVFVADKDTDTLLNFRYNPILVAEDGKNGAGQRAAGRSGRDLIVEVPVGTVVWRRGDAENGSPDKSQLADLTEHGQRAIIAHGGTGGFGNAHFKSSTRQTPIIHEVGEPGEEFEAELELKLLADVGLVGLPNAGKSTFLSVVTNAKPEIANYPFTTITPNLGIATIDNHDLLIADIPGLIEGAAGGKGLGHDFLRHVDRTAVLLHLVDVYNDDAGKAYKTIRNELEKYSNLASRPEIVALTKCEGLDPEIIAMQTAAILRENPDAKIYTISAQAHQGLDELLRVLLESIQSGDSAATSTSDVRGGAQVTTEHERRDPATAGVANASAGTDVRNPTIPTITLSSNALSDTWQITEQDGKFIITGEKIEKFARRTDYDNYASLNRLRDIMKKLGIRAELTSKGAKPDSIISIAGHEFPLVEDY